MEFNHKKGSVYVDDRRFEIHKTGFWLPQVLISEGDNVLLTQNHAGFWGSKSRINIGERKYEGKIKTGMLYNVHYTNKTIRK